MLVKCACAHETSCPLYVSKLLAQWQCLSGLNLRTIQQRVAGARSMTSQFRHLLHKNVEVYWYGKFTHSRAGVYGPLRSFIRIAERQDILTYNHRQVIFGKMRLIQKYLVVLSQLQEPSCSVSISVLNRDYAALSTRVWRRGHVRPVRENGGSPIPAYLRYWVRGRYAQFLLL